MNYKVWDKIVALKWFYSTDKNSNKEYQNYFLKIEWILENWEYVFWGMVDSKENVENPENYRTPTTEEIEKYYN